MAFSFLAGIRVLDLSQYLPGPLATQMLADLGADVVKVEAPAGDPQRHLNPMAGWLDPAVAAPGDCNPFYRTLNAGKRVVRLDLKADDSKARFARLLNTADVILESFRPGVMDRLGFGPEAARAANPGLVYCSLSGYGQTGPLRLAAGHDLNYMAASGALSQAGGPDGPAMAWPPMADCAGAAMSALAILGALVRRGRDGKGAYLDVAMADCVTSWQALGLTAAALNGLAARGQGLLTGGAACYRCYACADGAYLSVGALEDVFWANFCSALGRADWAARQWEPLPQSGLIANVAALLASRPLDHWLGVLDGVDTCVRPVLAYGEVAADPQARARGLVRGGDAGAVEVLLPLLADGADAGTRAPVRFAGADEILKDWKVSA